MNPRRTYHTTRRAQTSSNTLSPQDNTEPASLGFPRSTSPSNGFTQFLSRPSKWFGRTSSSSGRKHKISRPTDPRPILDSYSTAPGARSVMDLSSSRNPNSLDLSRIPFNNASQPSSPSSPFRPGGLGDLRAISKRAWSRSADDLTNMSTETLPAMGEKIAQYRNRSNSNVMRNNGPPSAPPTVPQPFPSMPTVSVSTPHVHTRSHSFTPKLASKLSAPLFPVSPKRKGSAGSEGAYPFSASIPSPTTHRSTTSSSSAQHCRTQRRSTFLSNRLQLCQSWPSRAQNSTFTSLRQIGLQKSKSFFLWSSFLLWRVRVKMIHSRSLRGSGEHSGMRMAISERRTFEALTHEAEFAASQATFEAELMRCCKYLVTGAEAEEEEEEKQRYLQYHDRELDFPDWPEWKSTPATYLPRSDSTRAIFNPTPVASPNIGDIRQPNTKPTLAFLDINSAPPTPASGYFPNTVPWASALDREGLSRDVLLLIDPKPSHAVSPPSMSPHSNSSPKCKFSCRHLHRRPYLRHISLPTLVPSNHYWKRHGKRVDSGGIATVDNNKGQGGIKEPRELSKALVPAPSGIGDVVVVGRWTRSFGRAFRSVRGGLMLEDDDAVKNRGGSLAMKVDQFISLSLAAEPKRKGLYEPFYWHKSSGQSLTAPLLPLLFPEPLPTITLLDRSQLLRGRVDSDATDIQHLRAVDGHLRAEDRRQTNQQGADGILASLNQKGTTIPVYNGDLLLVVQNPSVESSSTGSRPSSLVRSRPPSTADMDASLFLDGKSDLNAIGRTPSIRNSSEPPLRVLVQAGTLDRLVDILVQGLHNVSVSVADDNGEMSLRVGMTRELLLDHKEFTRVWWNVFRSFVTPLIFFELLRKIYLKSQPIGSPPLPDQYLTAISVKSQVLETVKLWLTKGGGAQDILDDSQLLQALRAFFSSSSDHTILHASPPTMFEDSSVRQAWDSLTESRQVVEQILCSQTMRPSIPRNHISRSTVTASESRMRNLSTREPPDMDRMSPEEFVDNIDGMAFAAFNNVTEEDLYITSDLLEVQSADRTGWFLPREITALEDHIEIQTIHTHIQEVEPSSLISELSPESLYRLLPPGICSCIRAHSIVRKWIVSKSSRLEFLLQVIKVARLRNAESLTPTLVSEQPCVRSFVEAAVTSAILSPECRMHQRAWQNIAVAQGCNYETLAQLLARSMTEGISSKEALTVDMGWLIERILSVIAMLDLVESQNEEGQSLVNFDKRRNLCNFISNAPSLLSRSFDLRGIKDEAYQESTAGNITGTPSRKISHPLQRLVAFQNLHVRLQKEKLPEQSRNEKREEQNKKSMSAFFSFMRPISSAFGADSSHAPTLKRTASELDFVPSGKPTLVLNLSDSTVSQFINNDRSFTFQLNMEDGGHYLLQAMSKREMIKWIETLAKISKTAAKRQLTYLGNSPGPQAADHIHDHPTTASRDPKAVFGVELDFLLERENGGGPISPGTIPSIIKHCLAQVESRGLTEVGIYQMAGASSEIAHLKEAFNRGDNPLDSSTDIHAVCDLIKSWFCVLPEPLFPPSLYHESIQIIKLENLDERLSNLRRIVEDLPRPNFDLLKLISEHLDRVTDYEEQNQMTAEALAIVFSPNLMRAPQNNFLMVLANMPYTHKLVKTLITHYHVIFDDTDAQAEAEAEDELDTAIAEVDSVEHDEGEFTNYIPTSPS
ncbi:hypothetical protein BDP27DRAFT_1332534 [Rhodocollybia butyracea]|uniref:Uncharacterized protein n=1 Tax=Rhodocollybia butyracea TaxID=206335 RepID=A0A9P5U4U4_9AGAR|nr:hypothetical protein BDP27DRAFT_1332534 [Rhodocollybia butyracea]